MINQVNYPGLVTAVKTILEGVRKSGAPISIITARGIMVATIIKTAPEILEKTFRDGSSFRCSDSFMRKWLHEVLRWSRRKGTQAAQKKLAALLVNSDQTQVVFAPGDKMTFTVLISVASDGTLLPLQAIYSGLTNRSAPSQNAPHGLILKR